eukprot:276688_1
MASITASKTTEDNGTEMKLPELTEDKIFNDMKELFDEGSIGTNTNSNSQVRSVISKKYKLYNIDEQYLKQHIPYKNAWKRFKPILLDLIKQKKQQEEQEQEKEQKKKKTTRRTRTRKRTKKKKNNKKN